VSLERCPELIVAILGILRAGSAWLPLDPSYPAERLAYMLEDSGIDVLVTNDGGTAGLPGAGVRRVDPCAEGPSPATFARERAIAEQPPGDTASTVARHYVRERPRAGPDRTRQDAGVWGGMDEEERRTFGAAGSGGRGDR